MNVKRLLIVGATVLVVLGLLYAAAWQHDHPRWHSVPESLTKPDPSIDRSRIPLGPYTVNVEGIIAGWSKDSVTFYVVLQKGMVHLQRSGEVGDVISPGAAVTHLSLMYRSARDPSTPLVTTGTIIDGLELVQQSNPGRLDFIVPNTRDANGHPAKIICSIPIDQISLIMRDKSFHHATQGSCAISFWPRQHLHALEPFVTTSMLVNISSFVPGLYRSVSTRIQGEP